MAEEKVLCPKCGYSWWASKWDRTVKCPNCGREIAK